MEKNNSYITQMLNNKLLILPLLGFITLIFIKFQFGNVIPKNRITSLVTAIIAYVVVLKLLMNRRRIMSLRKIYTVEMVKNIFTYNNLIMAYDVTLAIGLVAICLAIAEINNTDSIILYATTALESIILDVETNILIEEIKK